MPQQHIAFLDGVTGYLGRWTLFWFLEELRDERVAVLIRPRQRGERGQMEAQQRLDQVLQSIGMTSQRHRVTVIPGELSQREFNNPEAMQSLQADCWIHLAGNVAFKKLGDRTASNVNRNYTENFIETARNSPFTPRTVCHTSTFYVFEPQLSSSDTPVDVPETFHNPAQMQHHNAYGYSKLEAETYLQAQIEARSLPFNLLIFRPDIVMHHIPVKAIATRNPGLITDDFKVVYQLIAALIGKTPIPLAADLINHFSTKYLPVDGKTFLNLSDVDSITKAIMQLALLYADGGFTPEGKYQIFHLVNRWRPVTCVALRELCHDLDPEATCRVQQVDLAKFQCQILPQLSWVDRLYYNNFIEPFVGYMNRKYTRAITANVDSVLGEDWHNLHPNHGIDIQHWLKEGAKQAVEKEFGQGHQEF